MEKSPDAFRTISEVADWLGVQAHVLRFWESKFSQIKPMKRAGGRRYYRPADMALLAGIRKLLHDDGMTIKGAQKLLRERGAAYVASLAGEEMRDELLLPPAAEAPPPPPPDALERAAPQQSLDEDDADQGDLFSAISPAAPSPEPPASEVLPPAEMDPPTAPAATDMPEPEPGTDHTPEIASEPVINAEPVIDAQSVAPPASDSESQTASDGNAAPAALEDASDEAITIDPGLLAQCYAITAIPSDQQEEMRDLLAKLRAFADSLSSPSNPA